MGVLIATMYWYLKDAEVITEGRHKVPKRYNTLDDKA